MYRRGPAVRAIGLILASLQLTLPATVAWVDACLDIAAPNPAAAAHVDAPGTPTHAHVHPPDCPFCQFIGHQFDGASRVSLPSVFASHVVPERPSDAPHYWIPATRLPRQRAPPALL
jgi:hypothetical protein